MPLAEAPIYKTCREGNKLMTIKQRQFFAKVITVPWCGCWIWDGHIDKDGYGHAGGGWRAARVAYKLFVGPILPGYEIAHKYCCSSRGCVNPEHLIMLSFREHKRYDGGYPRRKQ